MERDHSGQEAKIKVIYDSLRGLLDNHLAKLPPDVANMVSDIVFAFYAHEAIVHALRVDNPQSQDALNITLVNAANDSSEQCSLTAEGEMALMVGSTTAAANPAYVSTSEPFGAELGTDFVDNFDTFYAAQLSQARVTATVQL